MALFDKVKSQAADLAQKAQEKAQVAGKAGAAKLDEVQARRRRDGLLHELGAAVFEQHQGRGGPQTDAAIARLVEDLARDEAERGVNPDSSPGDDPDAS